MLFLNREEVLQALDTESTLEAVTEALAIQEGGHFAMPERLTTEVAPSDLLILMPSAAEDAVATKILTLFPGNRGSRHPVIQGLVLLCDRGTGEFLAVLDGQALTAMRTAAVTALSTRYLARPDASRVGLIGCGAQGLFQLRFACAVRPIRQITLLDRTPEIAEAFAERLRPTIPPVEIRIAGSASELAQQSDILITATTARQPVFPDDPDLFAGKHCIAIGAFEPEVREYPDALFGQIQRVYVDTLYAMEESGELLIPLESGVWSEEKVESLGSLIASGEAPLRGATGTTFFKTVGIALFDLTSARKAYRRARELGIGTVV